MPAFSQSLEFVPAQSVNNTATVAVVYPNTATDLLVYLSNPIKGDGYFGGSDGLHTVMYTAAADFVGTMTVQASLATSPLESDWFEVNDVSVRYTELDDRNVSTVDYSNFAGNFVWIRGRVEILSGAVESIQVNH